MLKPLPDNVTRFWVVSEEAEDALSRSNLADTGLTKDALLRASWPVRSIDDQPNVLETISLPVKSIDRRPSLDPVPFHDVYFIQLRRPQSGCVNSKVEESRTWEGTVESTLKRMSEAGWAVDLLGIW